MGWIVFCSISGVSRPCLRGRFNRFLLDAMRGHDEANTRLALGN